MSLFASPLVPIVCVLASVVSMYFEADFQRAILAAMTSINAALASVNMALASMMSTQEMNLCGSEKVSEPPEKEKRGGSIRLQIANYSIYLQLDPRLVPWCDDVFRRVFAEVGIDKPEA